jgi:hypothetical protein
MVSEEEEITAEIYTTSYCSFHALSVSTFQQSDQQTTQCTMHFVGLSAAN